MSLFVTLTILHTVFYCFYRSGDFNVNFEHISHLFLVFNSEHVIADVEYDSPRSRIITKFRCNEEDKTLASYCHLSENGEFPSNRTFVKLST